MKRIIYLLVVFCCMALTSCSKESSYTINYTDDLAEYANVTVFEYNYASELMARREIKDAQLGVYEFLSMKGADYVVIGVEGIINGRITEWYAAEKFGLSDEKVTNIEVNFKKMTTQDSNPINPDDHVSRYLYK